MDADRHYTISEMFVHLPKHMNVINKGFKMIVRTNCQRLNIVPSGKIVNREHTQLNTLSDKLGTSGTVPHDYISPVVLDASFLANIQRQSAAKI